MICPRTGRQLPQPPRSLELVAFASAIYRCHTGWTTWDPQAPPPPAVVQFPALCASTSFHPIRIAALLSQPEPPSLISPPLCTASMSPRHPLPSSRTSPQVHICGSSAVTQQWASPFHGSSPSASPESVSVGGEATLAPCLLLPVPAPVQQYAFEGPPATV